MTANANKGVEYLISLAKQSSNGTAVHLAAVKALGEAGGPAAQEYLVSLANQVSTGTAVHMAAVAAIGRASREYA